MRASENATRLYCYALISSVEADIRRFMESHLLEESFPARLLGSLREKAAGRVSRASDGVEQGELSISETLLYSDLGDLADILDKAGKPLAIPDAKRKAIVAALRAAVPTRNRVFHSRPLEPQDMAASAQLCDSAIQVGSIELTDTKGTNRLLKSNPAAVLEFSIPEYWMEAHPVFNNLPVPDFDETGFIGRREQRERLLKQLQGSHPVISITGEGGVGKSSLALRVLYDLVESDDDVEFDAVIWVSLKTRVLTPLGIKEISGAISDATGILFAVEKSLGGYDLQSSDPFAQLSSYLEELNILLALDNLETLTDPRLSEFLEEVPSGSKILITSRVAPQVGLSVPLAGLDLGEAKQLFYQFCKVLGLEEMRRVPASKIESYCMKLQLNPLAIKWFIKSVSNGAEPARLLARSGDTFESILQFCFENVFESLDDNAREILNGLYVIRRAVSSTELAMLLGRDPLRIEQGLKQLHQSSLVVRRTPRQSSGDGTHVDGLTYQLSSFVEKFLRRFVEISEGFINSIEARDKEMRASLEKVQVTRSQNKWDIQNIRCRNNDQRLMLPELLRAVKLSSSGKVEEALSAVDSVIRGLPTSAEAYRLRGKICEDAGRVFDAEESYIAALDIDNDELTINPARK